MKQNASQEPIVQMTKAEIEEKRLSDSVIMPSDCDDAFNKWWRNIAPEEVINVRYPHERHGVYVSSVLVFMSFMLDIVRK